MVPYDFTGFLRGVSWVYRFAAVLAVLLLACLGQAGCAPAAPASRGTHNQLVAAIPAGSAAQALRAAAQQYTASTGEPVRVEVIAGESYFDRTSAALLSGLDTYDLLYLPADSLSRWVQYHALRPITTEIDRGPLEAWLPTLTFSSGESSQAGQLFALPAQPDPLVLWYRADLRLAAGLPDPSSSLETFRANALAMNAPPERYGTAMAGGESDAGLDYAALLAGMPRAPAREDLLGAFTSSDGQSGARQALAFYASLFREGVSAPGSEKFARADVIKALREGRAAMGFAPISAAAELLDCAASPNACVDGHPQLVATSLPVAASQPGEADCVVLDRLMVWAVPQRAANPQAAERFAAWLVSTEGARAWAAGGGLPAHTEVLQNLPNGAARLPEGIMPVLGNAVCYRQAFPYSSASDLFWKALHSAAHAAAAGTTNGEPAGGLSPETAFEHAVAEIRQGLRRGGVAP